MQSTEAIEKGMITKKKNSGTKPKQKKTKKLTLHDGYMFMRGFMLIFFSKVLISIKRFPNILNALSTGVDKFVSKCPTIRAPNFTCASVRARKKWVVKTNRGTTRNIDFCSLLPKQDLQLSFQVCFRQEVLQ